MPTYFNKILADLWCLLTSELSAVVVTLILVLLSQTLWLCRTEQPGNQFRDGFFSLSPHADVTRCCCERTQNNQAALCRGRPELPTGQ